MSAGASPVPAERDPSAAEALSDGVQRTPEGPETQSGPAAPVTMTPVQNDQQQTPERDSVERLEDQLAQVTLGAKLAEEGIAEAEARADEAEARAAAADAIAAAALQRAAAAEAVAAALRATLDLRARGTPVKLTIKQSLNLPGIYVYHVGCLTVLLIDQSGQEYYESWCVVKVGKAEKKTMDQRLQVEESDIRRSWRGSPEPCFTTRSLTGNDVGDLVACFSGQSWCGWEKTIWRYLGLPLGTGQVPSNPVAAGIVQMRQEQEIKEDHCLYSAGIVDLSDKITNLGWSVFFSPAKGKKSTIGPTELIMMPEHAMLRLRGRFQNNPADFSSCNSDNIVDGRTGPAWSYIQEAKGALPKTGSDWHEHENHVRVRFTTDGLIGPLTLQLLWKPDPDDEEEEGDDEEDSVTFDTVWDVTEKAVKKLGKPIGEGFAAMTDTELEEYCNSNHIFGTMETIQGQKGAIPKRKKLIVARIIKFRDRLIISYDAARPAEETKSSEL